MQKRLEQNAHITDRGPGLVVGDVSASKLHELSEILKRPEIMKLKNEYRLFVHLLVVAEGCLTGTLEQIGKTFLTDGRNIKGWLRKLDKAGMITTTNMDHRQIQVQIKEPYFKVASMRESQPLQSGITASQDPELEKVITIYETAKLTGQKIEINTGITINGKS